MTVAAQDAKPMPAWRRRPLLALGLGILAAVVFAALAAPWLAPHDPEAQSSLVMPQPPSAEHPLGTDSLGRDLLSRLLYGARHSLAIGVCATAIALGIGLAVGLPAGYRGGAIDALLMRAVDLVMAFPSILLAAAMAAVLPTRNLATVLLVIGLVNWTAAARVIRSEVLSLCERTYVEAARALGASTGRLLVRHIAPHLAPTLLVLASLNAGTAILLDTGLNYLGMGLPPPTPTWGDLLREAQQWYSTAPWLVIWPGLAVVVTVAAVNLIAFDLQRAPR